MKPEINNHSKVLNWIAHPGPAIFKGQDLRDKSAEIAAIPLTGCSFLGCTMDGILNQAVNAAGCHVMPTLPGLPFNPFSPGLYTPLDLYNRFDPQSADPIESYKSCLDWLIYDSYIDPNTQLVRPVDIDVVLMRSVHDDSMSDAVGQLLDEKSRSRCVAIMGGHEANCTEPIYAQIARLALELTNEDYFIVTGGGPGLMEAANLGAYVAGFPNPDEVLATAISRMNQLRNTYDWLSLTFLVWQEMGKPVNPEKSRSLGIPTWFYGSEPPNVFATDIAKYFANSIREEGLLALAEGGIIYAKGNAGTVQEIFQDANQNYYRTYGKRKSPMILFDKQYWNPASMNFNDPENDKSKQAYLLLHKLATEKRFDDYLFLSDDSKAVMKFIKDHPPVA